MTRGEALQAADSVAAEAQYRLQLAREAYEAGRQAGYRQAEADQDAEWAHTTPLAVHDGPSHAELDERRWGPGGRGHFADPRPGDFPGRGAQPRPGLQTQPDMEATP